MTNSLEEYAKICGLIANCNDIINGKFILAYNKIAALLKNLTSSKDVYNLLATHLNTFDFEREFSRAQFRSAKDKSKFIDPLEPEKLLPFVFCVLVNINNKTIDLDTFISEFFPSESGSRAEEFKNFAHHVIRPFRDIIAKTFGVPQDAVETMKVQPFKNQKQEEDLMEKTEELEKKAELDQEALDEMEQEFASQAAYEEETAERLQEFFDEIEGNCNQILSELPYDKKLSGDTKDDVEYITESILYNCEQHDLKNAIALITALDYVVQKSRTMRVYTREMKNVLVAFYDDIQEDDDFDPEDYDD